MESERSWLQWLGLVLGQAEARKQELHLGLSHGWLGSKHLGHLLLLS